MSQAAAQRVYVRESSAPLILVGILVSVLAHVGALAYLSLRPSPPPMMVHKPVELVMVEVEPPKPPEPPKEEEKSPEPTKVKPPPIKVAKSKEPPPPPPKEEAPPPPNDAPPPETPLKPVPIMVGISLSSTTSAGAFAAPVGNTVYGKTADKAQNPNEVKAYTGSKFTPVYQVDTEPVLEYQYEVPSSEYPAEARKAEIEGVVELLITVDVDGKVTRVRALKGPGYGLNEKAVEAIKKFRFKPAMKGGEPTATEMKWRFTFVLD